MRQKFITFTFAVEILKTNDKVYKFIYLAE